jgi:phosphohistidine phosphatase
MHIYFIRHGLADRSEWEGGDFDRPLTSEGRSRIKKTARRLRALGFQPDLMITSPLARARQTAEIIAKVIGLGDELVVDERLDPGFDADRVRAIMGEHSGLEAVALVGHEPSFSTVISHLVGGARIVCKKGSIARVDIDPAAGSEGELVWLLQPKTLIR